MYWLIGFVAVLVVVSLVTWFITGRLKPKPPKPGPKPAEPPPKPPLDPPRPIDPAPKDEDNAVTFYSYSDSAGKKKCPYCDGENANGVGVCEICGQRLA